MTISAAKHTEILSAQTAIARKVFEVVPIQDAWTSQQIGGALTQQTRSSIQFRTLEGCLNTLKDAGLIYELTRGRFQRVTPRETLKAVPMTTKPEVIEAAQPGAVEVLNELAARARRLAEDIEAAAEMIVEQSHDNEQALHKLNQLQAILKSLS
jgi:hypothetical protein